MNNWKGQKKTLAVIQLVHTKWNSSTPQQLLLSQMAEFPVKTLVSLLFLLSFLPFCTPSFLSNSDSMWDASLPGHCLPKLICLWQIQNQTKMQTHPTLLPLPRKNHPCPLPLHYQSLQNSLMIKSDSETLHQFQECFLLLTDFSAPGSGPPSTAALRPPGISWEQHQHWQRV